MADGILLLICGDNHGLGISVEPEIAPHEFGIILIAPERISRSEMLIAALEHLPMGVVIPSSDHEIGSLPATLDEKVLRIGVIGGMGQGRGILIKNISEMINELPLIKAELAEAHISSRQKDLDFFDELLLKQKKMCEELVFTIREGIYDIPDITFVLEKNIPRHGRNTSKKLDLYTKRNNLRVKPKSWYVHSRRCCTRSRRR